MDWFASASLDWEVFGDIDRIMVFVEKEKITPEEFKEITGEDY